VLVRPGADAPARALPRTGKETGSDVALQVVLVTADGLAVDHPRHLRTAERAPKRADRRVARRQQGSNRCEKAVRLRARKHRKVQRTRQDGHHTAALLLVRADDTIYLEDVRVAQMVRSRHLAKSIADAGWARFRAILASTAACAGKRVDAIPAHDTSQDCSGCGERVPTALRVRTHVHVCPRCGLVLGRDAHAAHNILRAGQAPQAPTRAAGPVGRASSEHPAGSSPRGVSTSLPTP
jgi:putative transposase